MTDFIIHIIIASLWCFGVYAVFDNDHLLGKVGTFIEAKTSTNFIRPLFGCPPCLASVHGFIWGLILYGLSWQIIPFCICLCGLNFIIKNIIFE